MRAMLVTLLVIDHEDFGVDEVLCKVEFATGARVVHHVETDIGAWSDDHPLNQTGCPRKKIYEYFEKE